MKTQRNPRGKLLATALCLSALGMGLAGNAQATAVAYASNDLQGFAITTTATYNIVSSDRNTTSSASYTGYSPAVNTDSTTYGSLSDVAQSTSGPGAFPAGNTFTMVSGMTGGRGDAITSAQSAFAPGGVQNVQSVAQAVSSSPATAKGAGGNDATIGLTLQVTTPGTFTFSLTDVWSLYAATSLVGESAQAHITNSFVIYDSLGNIAFTFNPTDAQGDLFSSDIGNRLCPATGGSVCSLGDTDYFTQTTGDLAVGTYTIALNVGSDATAKGVVPEPGSMFLLGIGMIGLAAGHRRRLRA